MTDAMKRSFATTYVYLIMNGRRSIEDVPSAFVDYVKGDLGMTE
ncbi:CD1375 family protein [Paenibacillus sp. JX-17]|uniref:CD1375 family protein n=1 Tax=Paenibacillus lacisoli TaxID=3064525 RepID=A0ABT9CGM3_9BACL|nr:CD1375 family protein [Paenibacillus sp. JX-17]MDO7908414.1 CD1375 family protein [Paenibacillus sp. JX-17]